MTCTRWNSEYVLGARRRTRGVAGHARRAGVGEEMRQVRRRWQTVGRSGPEATPRIARDRIPRIRSWPQLGAAPVLTPENRTCPPYSKERGGLPGLRRIRLPGGGGGIGSVGASAEVQRLKQELAQMQVTVGRSVARASLEGSGRVTKRAGVLRSVRLGLTRWPQRHRGHASTRLRAPRTAWCSRPTDSSVAEGRYTSLGFRDAKHLVGHVLA